MSTIDNFDSFTMFLKKVFILCKSKVYDEQCEESFNFIKSAIQAFEIKDDAIQSVTENFKNSFNDEEFDEFDIEIKKTKRSFEVFKQFSQWYCIFKCQHKLRLRISR